MGAFIDAEASKLMWNRNKCDQLFPFDDHALKEMFMYVSVCKLWNHWLYSYKSRMAEPKEKG